MDKYKSEENNILILFYTYREYYYIIVLPIKYFYDHYELTFLLIKIRANTLTLVCYRNNNKTRDKNYYILLIFRNAMQLKFD